MLVLIVDGLYEIIDESANAHLELVPVDIVVLPQRLELSYPLGFVDLRLYRFTSLRLRLEVFFQVFAVFGEC